MTAAISLERLAFTAVVFGLLVCSLGVFCCVMVAHGRRRRTLAGRPITRVQEWCRKNYGDLAERDWQHVEVVLWIFSEELGVHPTQLEPSDSLLHQYCMSGLGSYFDDIWDNWTEQLTQYLRTVRGREMTCAECDWCPPCVTLDDVIRGAVMLLSKGDEEI